MSRFLTKGPTQSEISWEYVNVGCSNCRLALLHVARIAAFRTPLPRPRLAQLCPACVELHRVVSADSRLGLERRTITSVRLSHAPTRLQQNSTARHSQDRPSTTTTRPGSGGSRLSLRHCLARLTWCREPAGGSELRREWPAQQEDGSSERPDREENQRHEEQRGQHGRGGDVSKEGEPGRHRVSERPAGDRDQRADS